VIAGNNIPERQVRIRVKAPTAIPCQLRCVSECVEKVVRRRAWGRHTSHEPYTILIPSQRIAAGIILADEVPEPYGVRYPGRDDRVLRDPRSVPERVVAVFRGVAAEVRARSRFSTSKV